MNKTVYLAGPLTGQKNEDIVDWRMSATSRLKEIGITTHSPIEAIRHRLARNEDFPNASPDGDIAEHPDLIFDKDTFLVRKSDLVLMDLRTSWKSVGTLFELGYAHAYNKPVVVICKPSTIERHPFIYRSSVVTHELDDALDAVEAFFKV